MKIKTLLSIAFTSLVIISACGNDNNNVSMNNEEDQNVNEQEENNNDVENESIEEDPQEENNQEEANTSSDPTGDDLRDVVKHFESEGYDIGNEAMKGAELIGASNGFGIELNGEEIELYLYEPGSSDLETIQEDGEYNMDGFILPAVANGNIVMIAHDEHTEADSVVETFNNY